MYYVYNVYCICSMRKSLRARNCYSAITAFVDNDNIKHI